MLYISLFRLAREWIHCGANESHRTEDCIHREKQNKEAKRAKQQPLIKKVGLIEIYSHFESPETQSGYNGIAMLKVRPGIDTCHCFVYNFSTANRFKSDWKLIEFS